MKNNTWRLFVAIVVCELAGIIGSIFTIPAIPGWYAGLVKPALNPPAWVFAPVWTTLFALMGISFWLVWKKLDHPWWAIFKKTNDRRVRFALGLFIVQLILNILWSVLFFGWQNPGAAFIEIVFLWLAIVATIISFARVSKPAAWLLAPYLIWVSFASYLTYALFVLN